MHASGAEVMCGLPVFEGQGVALRVWLGVAEVGGCSRMAGNHVRCLSRPSDACDLGGGFVAEAG